MIESLDIANLGVIASAHVEIGGGLVVVTGETCKTSCMVRFHMLHDDIISFSSI